MMSSVNDNIREVLANLLIDGLPQEACIPYKPHPGSYISLRKFLREDHEVLKISTTIANEIYIEIKHFL